MKEMLFIMVAVLVPPTLTYLGFVGDPQTQHAELAWAGADRAKPATLDAAPTQRAEDLQCWHETTF
jgi:hypothetical protein